MKLLISLYRIIGLINRTHFKKYLCKCLQSIICMILSLKVENKSNKLIIYKLLKSLIPFIMSQRNRMTEQLYKITEQVPLYDEQENDLQQASLTIYICAIALCIEQELMDYDSILIS